MIKLLTFESPKKTFRSQDATGDCIYLWVTMIGGIIRFFKLHRTENRYTWISLHTSTTHGGYHPTLKASLDDTKNDGNVYQFSTADEMINFLYKKEYLPIEKG